MNVFFIQNSQFLKKLFAIQIEPDIFKELQYNNTTIHIFQYCLGAVWIRQETFIVDHISVPVISVNRLLYGEESEVLD